MRNPVLTIFYQFDPWNPSIGGIQTLICSILKYSIPQVDLRFVGFTSNPEVAVGQWHNLEFSGRKLKFFPLFYIADDNIKQIIPTSVRYTTALLGKNFSSEFMHFYRIEPTIATLFWKGEKTLFVQNDIHQRLFSKQAKNSILWRKFPFVYLALERLLIRQFHWILSCNQNSESFYKKNYTDISERVHFFKNNVDEEIFYPIEQYERDSNREELANQLGLPHETRFVLFAGRLHPQKDPLLLLQAFKLVGDPYAHLLIVGEGELTELVKIEIDRLNLSKQVSMLGIMNQVELANLHRLSSAFVLTSTHEGLPFVVLEALACGTPVVSTLAGETPNILLQGGGLISADRTPQAIASSLITVLEHPEYFPVHDCLRAAEPYSAKKVISEIYQDIIERWNQKNYSQ